MANKKDKKVQDARTPASQLLLTFLKEQNLTLIIDEAPQLHAEVKGILYTVDKRPRVRVFYSDQIEEKKDTEEKKEAEVVQ